MIQRCHNPNNSSYKWYGAKGIYVCLKWRKFANFLSDVGEIPIGLTIDRINNNRGYEQSNVRLATQRQQQRNKSTNRIIFYKGVASTLGEHCERLGLPTSRTYDRLVSGWSIEDAFGIYDNTPAGGAEHPHARLTEEKVRAARASYFAGGTTFALLAKQYGLSATNMAKAILRKTWKRVQ